MADPLTQTVEEFAPAPLNLFDQKQAESIISRHSSARRNVEASREELKGAVDAYTAEQMPVRAEQDRIKAERDKLLATRDEEIYAQKKEGEDMRSQFIGEMYDALRPKEEGYDQRMITFFKGVPQSVQNDEVFREILKGYTTMSEKAEAERSQKRELETRQANTLEAIRERSKYNETMRNLTEEDWKNAPRDAEGNVDILALGIKAGERKRQNEIDQLKEKESIKVLSQKELIEARNANKQLKDEAKQVEDVLINDKTAFPDRAAMVRQQYADNPANLDYGTGKAAMEEAQTWDKNKFDNEIIAARDFNNPETYVNLITDLNEDQKENRRRLWEHANTYGGKLPPRVSGEPAPAAPAATPAPAAPETTSAPAPTAAPADFKPTEVEMEGKKYREVAPGEWEEVK